MTQYRHRPSPWSDRTQHFSAAGEIRLISPFEALIRKSWTTHNVIGTLYGAVYTEVSWEPDYPTFMSLTDPRSSTPISEMESDDGP